MSIAKGMDSVEFYGVLGFYMVVNDSSLTFCKLLGLNLVSSL